MCWLQTLQRDVIICVCIHNLQLSSLPRIRPKTPLTTSAPAPSGNEGNTDLWDPELTETHQHTVANARP